MPKSKKPRKAYRPRNTEGPVLPVVFRFSAKAETDLQAIPHVELDAMMKGKGTEYSLGAINFRINCGYVLSGETFENEEVRTDMEAGLAASRAVIARWRETGKIGCTGEQFRAIGQALAWCDEMQKASTRRELLHACEIVDRVTEWKLYHGQN